MKPNHIDPQGLFLLPYAPRDAERLRLLEAQWSRYSLLSDQAYELGMMEEGDLLSEAAAEAGEQFTNLASAIEETEFDDEHGEGDVEAEATLAYEDYRTGGTQRSLYSKAELTEYLRWLFADNNIDARDASDEEIVGAAYDAWLWKTKLRRRFERSRSK